MNDTAIKLTQRLPTLGGIVLFGLLLALYFSSLTSMWRIWGDSNTYTHGYVIFPIVGYLIWQKRKELFASEKQPIVWPSVFLFGLGLLWVLSRLLDVQVVEQAAFVAMIVVLTFGLYGAKFASIIMFPLAYLFLAVPAGEALVPGLMEFTADFTIEALKLSGIPVFRDGMYFSIPAGDFEVAKACSGIRYLMASFSLGTLFAYLSFRSFKKQFFFSLLSLLLPIVANGARAYGIVLIAHMTDMKHAVGVDHLLYGWMFFGIVMFALFYIGNKFRDDEIEFQADSAMSEVQYEPRRWLVPVVCLGLALIVPKVILSMTLSTSLAQESPTLLPQAQGQWRGPYLPTRSFSPNFDNANQVATARYELDNQSVHVWIYRYQPFDPDREMITETNTLVNLKESTLMNQLAFERPHDERLADVVESHLRDGRQEYLVWHWYQFDHNTSSGRIKAKALEAWSWVRGALDLNEAIVVLAVDDRDAASRQLIERFANDYAGFIAQCFSSDADSTDCTKGVVGND